MSLLGRIERMEKKITEREGQSCKPDAELLDEMVQLLREVRGRPKPPIRDEIARLRLEIAENEREEERLRHLGQMDDFMRIGLDRNQLKCWLLARAEAELACTEGAKP